MINYDNNCNDNETFIRFTKPFYLKIKYTNKFLNNEGLKFCAQGGR